MLLGFCTIYVLYDVWHSSHGVSDISNSKTLNCKSCYEMPQSKLPQRVL